MICPFGSGVVLGRAGANDGLNAARQREHLTYTLPSKNQGSSFGRLATPPYLTTNLAAC